MKTFRILMAVALTAVIALTSCSTHKKTYDDYAKMNTDSIGAQDFLNMVHSSGAIHLSKYVASKVKFTIEVGPQKVNLTGNLRMRRDDVIRLQLMAFGFVEAGRIEFTKDYMLFVDRINKQYVKTTYRSVEFLRRSGINFYTLQALFWNELFIPGNESVNNSSLNKFTTELGGDEAVIYLERDNINYSWLANQQTGRIKMANVLYRDAYRGNSQLNWNYRGMGSLAGKPFPNDMTVTLTLPKREVKMEIKLNYLSTDNMWETRTEVSEKYRQVEIDYLLRRIMGSL